MNNPKYDIHISYYPIRVSGMTQASIGGITQSFQVYNEGGYFISSMPVVGIYSTGSTYKTALDNLLLIATSSTTIDPNIPPYKSNW